MGASLVGPPRASRRYTNGLVLAYEAACYTEEPILGTTRSPVRDHDFPWAEELGLDQAVQLLKALAEEEATAEL